MFVGAFACGVKDEDLQAITPAGECCQMIMVSCWVKGFIPSLLSSWQSGSHLWIDFYGQFFHFHDNCEYLIHNFFFVK